MDNELNGKKAIITGGARGFGYGIAKEFVLQGADVCICSINDNELSSAQSSLEQAVAREDQVIISLNADVSDTADMDRLYSFTLDRFDGALDIVVNNAGIQGPIGKFEENNWDEVLKVIEVNLLGVMYSMRKAVSIFKEAIRVSGTKEDKSIVNVSGGGSTGARPNFLGYAVAKTGVVRATETLAREVEEYGIRVNAIAPGAMNTNMLEDILNAGKNAGDEYYKSREQKENGGASIENAAKCVAYLASERAAHITGRLVSAVWDGWENFEDHYPDIAKSDLYTLRRIIPKDRGYSWE